MKDTPRVVMAMTEFGSGYKKLQTCKDTGKAQSPLQTTNAKGETDEMFQKIFPQSSIVDVTQVPGGAGFMGNVFAFGYSPDMCGAWSLPNAASTLRVFLQGQVQVVAFPFKGLAAALKVNALDELGPSLLRLTATTIEEITKEVPGWTVTTQPEDVLYLPMGWMVCEKVVSGTLIYGVRKSYIVNTLRNKENYAANVDLLRKEGRDVQRYQEVMALMP